MSIQEQMQNQFQHFKVKSAQQHQISPTNTKVKQYGQKNQTFDSSNLNIVIREQNAKVDNINEVDRSHTDQSIKNSNTQPQLSQQDHQKCSRTKKIAIISVVIALVLLVIIGLTLGLVFGLGKEINYQLYPGLKIIQCDLDGANLATVVKKLDEQMNLINQNGVVSLQGGMHQQTFRSVQQFKFKASIPLISLVQEGCSEVGQDANKAIQSQKGLFKFYQAILLFLGREGLKIKGLNQQEVIVSNVDNQNYVRVKYDDEKGDFIIQKLEQEPVSLDSDAEQKPLSNANLPQCEIQKALPFIVQILKGIVEKHIQAYKREISNGGKEAIESLIVAQNVNDQQNTKIIKFIDSCVYLNLNDVTYNCKTDVVESVINQAVSDLQGMAASLKSGQSDRIETELLQFMLEI